MEMKIEKKKSINGEIIVPGDKSISHRSIMLGAIGEGSTNVNGFLNADDCNYTALCFQDMGIKIEKHNNEVLIHGKGLTGLCNPNKMLFVGNSGTTIRLLSGILAGQKFNSIITGDESIEKRPMNRIINPIRQMGGEINSVTDNGLAPLIINPSKLVGIDFEMPIASAQLKSAIILASLYAKGETKIIEKEASRNHTELMLKQFGADISVVGKTIIVNPTKKLMGQQIKVPGDISSAAFFIVAALIMENSDIIIKNVGLNETRNGIITVLKNMGGKIDVLNKRRYGMEEVGDLRVRSSELNGTVISGEIIPSLIDEIPIIAIAALFAKNKTIIKDAEELKVKETNRITAMYNEIKKIGGDIVEHDDGLVINGGKTLNTTTAESYGDHRIAMSMAIAGLKINGGIKIKNTDCVSISFPDFFELLNKFTD